VGARGCTEWTVLGKSGMGGTNYREWQKPPAPNAILLNALFTLV